MLISVLCNCWIQGGVKGSEHGCYCSIVVSTSDCGSENPGSNPGSGNFLLTYAHTLIIISHCMISNNMMEPFRNTLVRLINEVRVNPASSGDRLYNQLSSHYEGEELHYFEKHIETFEGLSALTDYRNYTRNLKSVKALTLSPALCRAAQAIAEEKGQAGRSDHDEPRAIYERISVGAQVDGRVGELIALNTTSSEETAAYFLVDDGLATRKRRRMLLDEGYGFIGVGTAYHRQYDSITVVLLADHIAEAVTGHLGASSWRAVGENQQA